jgi:GNAT superfamily N-acetyltransferase
MQRAMQARFGGPQQQRAPAATRDQGRRVVQSAANRQVTRAAVPFGLGYVTQPIVNTITDPTRRGAAVRGFQGLARDLDRPIDFGALGRNTIDAAGRGLANAPAAVVNMATHLPEMARSLTYGPIEDEENAQRRLDMARLQGDQSGVQSNANEANTQTANNTINFATSAFGPGVAAAKAGQATTRGLPLLFQQMGHSGAVGAGFAGANAALTTPGGLEDRLPAAVEALPGGFATGAVMPVAVNGFSALGSLAQRALPRRGGAAPPAAPAPQAPPSGGVPDSPSETWYRGSYSAPRDSFRPGTFITDNERMARAFTDEGGTFYELQQSFKNPYRPTQQESAAISTNPDWRTPGQTAIYERMMQRAADRGHDVIVNRVAAAPDVPPEFVGQNEAIIVDPNSVSVRSAAHNSPSRQPSRMPTSEETDAFIARRITENRAASLTPSDAAPQQQSSIPRQYPQMGDNAGVRQEQMTGQIGEEWARAEARGLDMSQEARMARAKAMGFDTETRLYHGTSVDPESIKAFDLERSGSATGNDHLPAIWVTPDSDLADSFSQNWTPGAGENAKGGVLSLLTRGRLMDYDMKGAQYHPKDVNWAIWSARNQKFDGVRFKNMIEAVSPNGADQIAIFDPRNIRSIHAAFDPNESGATQMMSGQQSAIPRQYPQMGDNAGVRQEQMRGAIPESELLPIRAEPIDSQYVNLHVTTPGGGRGLVQVRLGGDYVRILKSHIYPETERGRGYGTRMYASVLDWASSNGYKRVLSDGRLSPDSQRIYPALQREGYNVQKKRSATTRLDQSGYPEVFSSGNRSIYSVQAERASPQQQSAIPRQYPQMPAKPQPQFGMTFAPPNGQFYSNPIPLPRRTGGGSRPPMRNVTPPGPPPIPEQGRLNSLARRSRRSVTQIEADIASERANPQGRRVVDLFGAPGVSALRPMVRAPGRTEALAVDVASQRFQAAPERIVSSLRRHLQVGESRQAAMRRLAGEYDRVSAETYNPMFRRPLDPERQAAAQSFVEARQNNPVMRDAQARAQRIFDLDRDNGLVQGSLTDNYARALHYMKMGLDDASKFAASPLNGIGATELRGIREMRRQFVNMMDETIPGYGAARREWGGIAAAEEAMEEGAGFWKLPSDEVQARVGEMTPDELRHARIGMAHELEQKIGLAGSTTGNLNVANIQALRSPEMQRRLRAVFRTPEEAAAFFGDTGTQNQLMRNSAGWIGGSTTQGNLAHEADGALQTALELGGHAATGNWTRFAHVGARKVANAALNNVVENSNNRFGEVLLNDMSDQQWTEEFLNILRQGERGANTNTRTSRVAAAATGAQTGRNRKRP